MIAMFGVASGQVCVLGVASRYEVPLSFLQKIMEEANPFCHRVKMKPHPSSQSWLPALTQCGVCKGSFRQIPNYYKISSLQQQRCYNSDWVLLNELVWKLTGHRQIDCVNACGAPSSEWPYFVLCPHSFLLNWIVITHLLKCNVI